PVADLRLQSVVIADAEIHYRVDLTYAARNRQDWTCGICCGHGSNLSGRSAIEHRGGIQINSAIKIGPVLMHVVCPSDQPSYPLLLYADGNDLAAGIHELIRIVRQLVEVQPEF